MTMLFWWMKQARHDKYLSLLLDLFSVWKLALRNKKEVEGRRDNEREKILLKIKGGGGGGVKASLNDFVAPERR